MSKDDACKVTSASKHKERKPKKPHYIPRPWGKPYNYKCFQCPFTCMEKSHLYNHMKYSLCKNSLSLLIESDWPYKKGRGEKPEVTGLTKESSSDRHRRDAAECPTRKIKQPESDLLMADMLSLEDQLLRARSVEVEAQLKHYKLSKTYLTAPSLLSEQWRLLASSHSKAKAEGAQVRVSSSIPCYPPPPNLVDYQDPTGLNLSVLGVGYPISPSLFSYMNLSYSHCCPSSTHIDRALIPPRLYYPFLCEHTFGPASSQSDANKALKTSTNSLEVNPLSGFQPKVNLWKVFRPGPLNCGTTTLSPAPTAVTACCRTVGEGTSESVAALLSDLSKALQEYQEAECKISHLEKEDLPAQRHLWEHLGKIRSELSHIHQALEQTARPSDGPLDLSVKRDSTDLPGDRNMREDGKVLSAGGLGMRPSSAEALWPSRTTKCEADSSVLLCPDGRSVVFTDIPSSAKTPKRPPTMQRLEAQCPPSPLTATDN
uniref:Proline rich 35 n=1 Tax=Cyclopterus lumpus TaxID=8103 RepID=A0A8C2XVB7_CYCLU